MVKVIYKYSGQELLEKINQFKPGQMDFVRLKDQLKPTGIQTECDFLYNDEWSYFVFEKLMECGEVCYKTDPHCVQVSVTNNNVTYIVKMGTDQFKEGNGVLLNLGMASVLLTFYIKNHNSSIQYI